MILVRLDGCFRDKALSDGVHLWLKHAESIGLDEQSKSAARGLATDARVTRLLIARTAEGEHAVAHGLPAVGPCLAGLPAVAAWQAVAAMRERDRVSALRDQTLSRQLAAQSAASKRSTPCALCCSPCNRRRLRAHRRRTARCWAPSLAARHALSATRRGLRDSAVPPSGEAMVVSDVRGAVFQAEPNKPALKIVVPPRRVSISTGPSTPLPSR